MGILVTPPQPGRHNGTCMVPAGPYHPHTPDEKKKKKTPGQRHCSPATPEDVARMKGTPATDPQKHGGSTLPGPWMKKKDSSFSQKSN